MKKSILSIVFALLYIAIVPAQESSIEKDLKMYNELWNNIANNGQIELINEEHFDANVTIPMEPDNIVGIEAFKDYYQNYLTGFSDIKLTILKSFGQGDNILKYWNFKGKHTGEFFGIPATNNMVDVNGVTLVKMKNGKIAEEMDVVDNMAFLGQLGLVSDPNNLKVIDDIYKSFAIGDIPAVLAAMDANINWREAESNKLADGNPYIGPDAVLNGVFGRLGQDHEYFKVTDIKLHEMSNNKVLATVRYDAKFKESGKPYNAQAAHLWTLKDGKVVAFQQYVDTKKLAEAEKNNTSRRDK